MRLCTTKSQPADIFPDGTRRDRGGSGHLPAPVRDVRELRLIPYWDEADHALYVGGVLVKRFRSDAPQQESILHAFQEHDWPACIPFTVEEQSKDQLRDAVRNLNRSVKGFLRFRQEGNGTRIRWESGDTPSGPNHDT